MIDDTENSKIQLGGSHKTGKYTGYGTTHKIRAQLNFNDEKKWKKFSSRRLELIDSFGLSQHKASEQDDNIRQIATILRSEFEYPDTFSAEFEKLVTAAVQSVRRNRKRSKKKLLDSKKKIARGKVQKIPLSPPSSSNMGSCSASNASSSDEEASVKEEPAEHALPSLNTITSQKLLPYPNGRTLPPVPTQVRSLLKKNASLLRDPSAPYAHGGDEKLQKFDIEDQPLESDQEYDFIAKSIIVEIVNNAIPLPEQTQRDKFIRPNLTEKKGCQSKVVISNNLRKLILSKIHNSRTCLEMSKDERNLDSFANLETLGKNSLMASISLVVENSFSHLPSSTKQYLTERLSSIEFLTILSQRLFMPATRQLFADLSQEKIQVRVLNLILGSLVKDYGFDASLAPINEIIYHMTLHQYPLVCSNKQSNPMRPHSTSEVLSAHSSTKDASTPGKEDPRVTRSSTSADSTIITLPSIEVPNTYDDDRLKMLSAISLQIENSTVSKPFSTISK